MCCQWSGGAESGGKPDKAGAEFYWSTISYSKTAFSKGYKSAVLALRAPLDRVEDCRTARCSIARREVACNCHAVPDGSDPRPSGSPDRKRLRSTDGVSSDLLLQQAVGVVRRDDLFPARIRGRQPPYKGRRRSEVRFREQTGKHLLSLSFTGYDPTRTLGAHWRRFLHWE
jgi:hypothetical protein